MADPKTPILPKQLSEESVLDEFTMTGNVYVDKAYTSQAVVDAEPINGKSPITGETLVVEGDEINALSNFTANNGNSPAINPEDGHAIFISNLDRGTSRGNGHDYFFNFNRNKELGDIYIVNAKGGDFSASPRVADTYVADSDGTLNVYIEGSTFGGNLMGFGSQTNNNQTFTGNYEFTFKNSVTQWFAITYGTGYGLGEGNANNNRFGTFIGNIDLVVDGGTFTGNSALLRGSIRPGGDDEKAYIHALFKDSDARAEFGMIMTGSGNDPKTNQFKSFADIDVTIENTRFNTGFVMLPNGSTASVANSGENAFTGNVTFKMTGSTVNSGLVLGAGRRGANNDGRAQFNGNIDFTIIGSTVTGELMLNKGTMNTEETPGVINGKIEDSTIENFLGIWTGGTGNFNYADINITVTNTRFALFDVGHTYDDKVVGDVNIEFVGSTASRIWSDRRYNDNVHGAATYSLVFKAHDKASKVTGSDGIRAWNSVTVEAGANVEGTLLDGTRADEPDTTLTVEAGASLRLSGALSAIGTVTLKGANLLSAKTVSEIGTLSVEDTSLTSGDIILISGLSEYEDGIETVLINDEEFTYGMFGGQYELVGTDLVAHLDPTYLVNDHYDEEGEETSLGVKGYKTLAVAQTAARADNASLIFTNMDEEFDPPSFTADVATLDVATKFVGISEDEDEVLDLNGASIIIGGDTEVASAAVVVSYATNINTIRLGTGTGTATASIDHIMEREIEIPDPEDPEETITVKVPGLTMLDLTGSAVKDASITVSSSSIADVKLADNAAATGKVTIIKSTIDNVYAGAGDFQNDLTDGNTITNLFAEGHGDKIKLGTSTVKTYIAGSNTQGAEFETLAYNDTVSADTIIVGGNANVIGDIEATITGGAVKKLIVGNDGDTISGDVSVNLSGGEIDELEIAKNATLASSSNVDVVFTGGTVATDNGTFYGLIYGASVTGAIDGGSQGVRTMLVNGYARVGSVKNFDSIEVVGGTLNVESGERKDNPTAENSIDISGDILNRRAIQAGAIKAKDLTNYGMIGVLRNSDEDPGIQLSGDFFSDTFVRTSVLTVAGDFTNSGEITSVGDITIGGKFTNSGEIYIRSSFDKEYSLFSQDGGITLNNADMENTGKDAFISTGFLTGVKDLSTSRLYVTGGADITGSITIEAGAEVAFTNKANPERANGLSLGGNITMYDTSSLIVSGSVPAGKTLTIKTEGEGLVGSNVLVKSEGGLDSWQISWGAGLSANSYYVFRDSTTIVLYSVDELFVNSAYANLEDGDEVKINGKTYVIGVNAFGSVEDATYFAGTKGFTSSKIAIVDDKTGKNVDTTYGSNVYDLVLYNSTVGTVTAKNVLVESSSTVKSIDAAASLTIDASAVLTVTDTLVDGLPVVIDAAAGSGARKVISVNPAKVQFVDGQVTVMPPLGSDSYAVAFSESGDTVYLKANANIFLLAEGATIVDGVTVDKATGDVLFAGVNAFKVEADAAAAAQASGGTLWIADGSNKLRAIAGVSKVALEYNGSSSIYGSTGESFESTEDYSVEIAGSVSSGKAYGLNKSVNMSGDFTLNMSDCHLTGAQSALYIVGNDVKNVVNGNVNAVLENVRVVGRQDNPWGGNGGWNEGIYLGYGSFGTDDENPIDVNVTLRGVTATSTGFYGIQTQPSDGPTGGAADTSTSSTDPKDQVRQDINANINIKVYDSVIGGTFTVLNTNNEHWDANGASLLNTYFSSGSITVEVGNSDFGTSGAWRNIRLGASLQGGGKAIQEFNVPNTLHIVATDNGTTTRAAYVNEWDTLIVDATAQLWLNNEIQYSTGFGPNQPLDDAGTLTQIMINMSGYKSGTHNVITANSGIATDAELSNITVIGDNDLTGQCQLAYAFSGDSLRGIYIFDKADDMYVNGTYTDSVNGTKAGNQELLLNYNAYTSFVEAVFNYADAWGGSIVVTGGQFGHQDFHGNNVEVSGATIASVTMVENTSINESLTLTVKDGAELGSVDGSNDKTESSVLAIEGNAKIDEITGFDTVTVKSGLAPTLGTVTNASLELFADNEVTADSISFSGTETIVLDVTGYTDKSHAVISTTNGITGFNSDMVEIVAHDKGRTKTDPKNYSLQLVGNDLVLRSLVKSDTYLNSEYTVATQTILDDGTYIEYGLNAFSDPDAAVDNLGSQNNTLTVTGSEISGDIRLGGANFVMEKGIVDGVIYACVNTADKGSFYSGKTYTVTAGTIGGIDLTAGEGVYTATNSAIKLGEDVTINGNVIGGGDTVITSEGEFTVSGLIMGVKEIVLNADGFLSAGGINLGSGEGSSTVKGTIRVKAVPFVSEDGNRRLLIDSDTDIQNATFAADPGTALYNAGKQVYVIDLSRVYFDPTYTVEVDGTKAENGDTLLWGINAFSNYQSALGALITGGTLYVNNGNGDVNTSDKLINLVVTNSTIPVIVSGMTSGDKVFSGDASVVLDHVTLTGGTSTLLTNYRDGSGEGWNHRSTIEGNLYVTINDSTIGGGQRLTFVNYLTYTGEEMVFNITDTTLNKDIEFFGDSGPLRDGQKIVINMTNVKTTTNKSWYVTSGNPGNEGEIIINLKGCSIGTGSDMRLGTQSTWQWGNPAGTTDITFSVEDTYFRGYLTANSIDANRQCNFSGEKTLVISGSSNYVHVSVHFNKVNISADSFITGSTMSLEDAVMTVDGAGYEGPTKTLVRMSTTLEGIDEIVTTGLTDNYVVVQGELGIVLSDGSVGNQYYDKTYDSKVTGTTSANGDILIYADDAEDVERGEIGNAQSDLEDAKANLHDGYKLYVAASDNVLFGTMDDEDETPFVNMVITNGDFSDEDSLIAAADVDEDKTIAGDSVIELAGGSIGKPGTEEDEPIYATIDGTKDAVDGTSEFILSKVGGIYADVKDFDKMTVTSSESRVHGSITVDALALSGTAFLTVDGTLDTGSIHISTEGYDGASKRVLVADALETIDEANITVDEGGEFFLDRTNKSLWLVSTAAGNVYINTSFDDSINGQSLNGDLLFNGLNAFNAISKDIISERATSKDTVYILDGNFGTEAIDLSGIGTRKLEFQGGSVSAITVDAGSTVSVTGTTSAVSIASIAGAPVTEGELITKGYGVTLKPASKATIGTISDVNYFRFNAANAANISVSEVDFLENGGQFIVDFQDYTIGDASKVTLFTAANGVNNFIQYVTPEEGDAYSTTVMETRNNNAERLMVYYDEENNSVYAIKRGNAGFLEASADNSVNGTVEEVEGVANTKVYGFNVSTSLSTVTSQMVDGDILVIRDVNRSAYNSNITPYVNIVASGSTFGAARFGATATNDNDFVRVGDGTMMKFDNVTFTDAHDVYLLGNGTNGNQRLTIVAGTFDDEGEIVNGVYSIKFTGGGHTNTSGNGHFRATQNAKIGGGTMAVSFEDYNMNGDVQLFDDVYGYEGQLDKLEITLDNVVSPDAKYIWFWDPNGDNTTEIALTIKNTVFRGGTDSTIGLFGDNTTTNWTGKATVTISGFTTSGTLSGARGLGRWGGDVDSVTEGNRVLVVEGGSTNSVNLVKMFNEVDIDDTALLTGATVSFVENNNTGFVLLGESGKDYGRFKTFLSVTGEINNASGAKFVDKNDEDRKEIEGYTAVVGPNSVFVYKQDDLGDVFYNRSYSASSVNGLAVKNADESDTVLVFGENAFSKLADAYTALEEAAAGTAFQITGANDSNLYAYGHKTIVSGGRITNLFGGAAPDTTDPENPVAADPVASVDISVNTGATVTNLTVANALSSVTGNALVTIADGIAMSGKIDGGSGFVGETSSLVFKGAATAGSIVGFDTVTLNANDIVSLTGEFTGTAITIDATGFTDFTKKVLTATDITVPETGITVINGGSNTFGWQIVADGNGKALLITSDLVKDTYANASWTPESELGFVGDTALVFDKNAFNSAAAAAAKVGEENVLHIEGGVFSKDDAVTLANDNDVVVSGNATIGALTTGGKLTVSKGLSAASIDGVSSVSMVAANAITVDAGVALAEKAKISIDVTGFNPDTDDVVVLSTTEGITIDTTEGAKEIDNTVLSVTGEGASSFYAYYSTEDSSVHLLKLETLYLSTRWDGGNNIPEYFELTGDKLIYNVNAFDRMNTAGQKMVDGQKFWAYYRNGDVHTGGPNMPEGEDSKFLSEVHVVQSDVGRIVLGGTIGEGVYVGDTHVIVDHSTIATSNENDSWLVSEVTSDQPWNHRNTLFGNVTVDVTDSTIGTAANPGGVLRIVDFTNVVNRSADKKSAINVNFTNTEIYKAVRFLGDSPMGKDVVREAFSTSDLVDDGGKGTTEELNINLDNVKVDGAVEWAIRGGGARDQVTGGTVTVNMKDTTFGANAIFAIEDNWNEGNGVDSDLPKNGSDFIFTVENTTINGYLVAGRRQYTSTLADLSVDSNGYGYSGKRVLNVIGTNTIKNALFFKDINLTGDSSLLGGSITLFNGNGLDDEGTMAHVDGKINIDLTGYEGASRALIALTGNIVNFDPTKSLVVTGLVEPAEGEKPKYEILTDYDAETNTISKIVLKGGIKDIFVNSLFKEEDFDPILGNVSVNGDAMFYGENAFSVMTGYEDPTTGDLIPGALDKALTIDGTILHITAGGAVETATLLNNSITIDAGGTLAYQGDTCITVDGTIQNNGNFVIDAAEFIKGAPDRVTVLVADEILGNNISVTTKTYAVEKAKNDTTGKWEITLVRKAENVFVNTEWAGLPDATEVIIGGNTAYIGFTAFADADTALSKVNNNGTLTVVASDVAFTNPIARNVTVIVDGTSTVSSTTIGSDTDGALELQAGAIGIGLNVQGKSTLTVDAGATVTGGLGMSTNATVVLDNDATLDFYIVGQNKIEGPRVKNLSRIGESTPNFTVTIDEAIKDGSYQLANDAAAFKSNVTLQTATKSYGELVLGEKVEIVDLAAFFQLAIDDNNVLTLTKIASQSVIYVNSDWTTEGAEVIVDGVTVTVGENGFATGDAAVEQAAASGATSIKVVGGTASFSDGVVLTTIVQNAELQGTDVFGTLTVSETATLSGKFTFAPGEDKTITVNGTVAFDTANMTAASAQVTGLSNATFGNNAKFTLNVADEVKLGDSFLLATGAEGFGSTISLAGTDIVLEVGETKKVGNLGYKLSLTEGNLVLDITDKPVPTIVYVNSTWTVDTGETVPISESVTATIGYDAFKNGNAAYSAVASDGEIVVLGGVVSFTDPIAKSLSIVDGVTLTGKAAFVEGTVIAIDGTILFDTQYAATAQISGLSVISGTTKYELVDDFLVEGEYVLASDASGFNAEIKFGNGVLTVGGAEVEIEDLNYSIDIDDNNALVLTVTKDLPPKPETVYVSSEWASVTGEVTLSNGEKAMIGVDAFAKYSDAVGYVADDGNIVIDSGEIAFAEMTQKTTVNASVTVTGMAVFTADTPITIAGTFMFDTAVATATEAQITGFTYIKGDVNFALTDSLAGEGVYRLATDVVSFNKPITIEGKALTLDQSVQVNGYDYSLALDAGNLTLTVAEIIPTPTQAYVNSEWAQYAKDTIVPVYGGTAKIGYDAFADLASAIDGTTDDGKINVVGGFVSFADGYSKTITVDAAATVFGTANFDKAITIDGTINFSTAFATAVEAQYKGFSNVTTSDTTFFTLTDANPVAGNYLLASGVESFDKSIKVEDKYLSLGQSVRVNGYDYSLALSEGNLMLTVAQYVPVEKPAKFDIDGNGISEVMFVWTGYNYAQGYWMNGTSVFQSTYMNKPADWNDLGCYDMDGNGKADSVLISGIIELPAGKGNYVGYYTDAVDYDDNWVNINFLNNPTEVEWQYKICNLTGNANKNSIIWYQPDMFTLGAWLDGTNEWALLSGDFGGEGWKMVGCGDFDGDGKDSVLMTLNNGQMFYSVGLDGVAQSHGYNNWIGWEVRAIGDFAGDGMDDIVLFHKDLGSMAMLIDGNADNFVSVGQLDAKDWFVVGCGDYNGDAKDDLLVRQYSTGMLGYYNSGNFDQWVELGRGVDLNWTVIA